MKQSNLERLKIDVQVIIRNLNIFTEKLVRTNETQFELNITETKAVMSKIKTIKKKSAELTTMF